MIQIFCLLLVCLAGSPVRVQAQAQPSAPAASEPPPSSPEYQKLIDDGIQEFRRGNFAEARSLLTRANKIHPNARTLRGLGMTELELGNYIDSIGLLRSALDSKVRPLSGALRSETEAMLARAEGFIGHFTIEATPVSPTTVLVDGLEVQLRDGNVLPLKVGDHVIELAAAGYPSVKLLKKVQGGEKEALPIAFQRPDAPPAPLPVVTAPLPPVTAPTEPAPLVLTPASMPPRDQDPRRPLYKNPWLWTAVGVVTAGAAVGLALGLKKDARTDDPIVSDAVAFGKGP